jgi:class 3 adenylate cyclase
VEQLTRTEGAPILLTDAVRAHLDPRFAVTPLPPLAVRGVAEPVATFRLDGVRD